MEAVRVATRVFGARPRMKRTWVALGDGVEALAFAAEPDSPWIAVTCLRWPVCPHCGSHCDSGAAGQTELFA